MTLGRCGRGGLVRGPHGHTLGVVAVHFTNDVLRPKAAREFVTKTFQTWLRGYVVLYASQPRCEPKSVDCSVGLGRGRSRHNYAKPTKPVSDGDEGFRGDGGILIGHTVTSRVCSLERRAALCLLRLRLVSLLLLLLLP